jgi:hypothetical protein
LNDIRFLNVLPTLVATAWYHGKSDCVRTLYAGSMAYRVDWGSILENKLNMGAALARAIRKNDYF